MSEIEKKEILIVDDEGWYTEPIIERLVNMGYTVKQKMTVTAGLRAFEEARNNKVAFRIVIADLMLPYGEEKEIAKEEEDDIPGRYLIKKMREIDSKLPIFCYTVIAERDIIDLLKDDYNITHFAKGTREDQYLFEDIGSILGNRK